MQTEIEATFLDVDCTELRHKLKELGAALDRPEFQMKRTIYDYEDLRLDKKAAWIRVREEFDKKTLSFKHRQSEDIDGMKEVEFEISDYDAACNFLESIGLKQKAAQETKREVWKLNNCEIMLDEWPWIPPYAEVEGPDKNSVELVSRMLGFDFSQAIFDSVDAVYQKYFDVTRTEISTIPITFGQIPDWLEAKRRKS